MKYLFTFLIAFITVGHIQAQILDSLFGIPGLLSQTPTYPIYANTPCDFDGRQDQCFGIIHLSDGRIILAGDTRDVDGSDFALARLLPDGNYDNSAGTDGEMRIDLGYPNDSCLAAVKYADTHILMGGAVQLPPLNQYVCLLAKVDFNGQLDATFGDQGKLVLDLPGSNDMINEILPLPNGNFLIGGNVLYGSSFDFPDSTAFFVGRLLPDGTIDSTFGANGFIYHRFEQSCRSSLLGDIAIDQNGRILVTGGSYDPYPNNYNFNDWCKQQIVLYRFLPNGAFDANFGIYGKVELEGKYSRGTALQMYEDGRILLAGTLGDPLLGLPIYTLVARIMPNGDLDPTFGTNGQFQKFLISAGSGSEPTDIVLIKGNIFLSTLGEPTGGHLSFGTLCLTNAGVPCTNFGSSNGRFRFYPEVFVGYEMSKITSTDSNSLFISGYYSTVKPSNMLVVKLKLDGTSATNQVIAPSSISVHPNPTNGLIYITLPDAVTSKEFDLLLRDLSGRVVFSEHSVNIVRNVGINIPDLSSGVYILELTTDQNRFVSKIIMQH